VDESGCPRLPDSCGLWRFAARYRGPAVTLEIYTHEDRQAQREAIDKISDALRRDGQNGQ
jgi:hypothetical protein